MEALPEPDPLRRDAVLDVVLRERVPAPRDVERKKAERERERRGRAPLRRRARALDELAARHEAPPSAWRARGSARRPANRSCAARKRKRERAEHEQQRRELDRGRARLRLVGVGRLRAKPAIASFFEESFEQAQRVARRRERDDAEPNVRRGRSRRSSARATGRRPVRSRGRSRAGSSRAATSSRSSIDFARSSATEIRVPRGTTASTGSAPGPAAVPRAGGGTVGALGGRARRKELVRHVREDDEPDRGLLGDEAAKRPPDRRVVVVGDAERQIEHDDADRVLRDERALASSADREPRRPRRARARARRPRGARARFRSG